MASSIRREPAVPPVPPPAGRPAAPPKSAAPPTPKAASQAGPPKAAAPKPEKPAKPPAAAQAPPPKLQPKPPEPPSDPPPAEPEAEGGGRSSITRVVPPFVVSMLVHIVALLSLALVVNQPPPVEKPRLITSSSTEESEDIGEEIDEEKTEEEQTEPTENTEVSSDVVVPETAVTVDVQAVTPSADVEAAAVAVELSDFSSETAPTSDLLQSIGAGVAGQGGGISARGSPKQRQQLLKKGGGNEQSENAVEAALKWLLLHQMPDGGWSFDLAKDVCGGECTHGNGTHREDRGAATAMALLPFFGRGYTHTAGPYQEQLLHGINFLASLVVAGQGQLKGGGMYSQGLAGIALSEAYAMTQDNRLQMPAQLALNYIMAAQDPVGGSWGYRPRSPGDTSIVGWQLMALKSGHMAYLEVNPLVIKKAVEFLNSVESDSGASYGYAGPGDGAGTTAVGLLCRMYLGWKKDHPGLDRGVTKLAKKGPRGANNQPSDLYFCYYATQVLHHVEDERWVAWNTQMRDLLIEAQVKSGHMAGSWFDGVDGGHGAHVAGRLYCTSLATMILEVYYRHLPIYSQQSVDEEFKE